MSVSLYDLMPLPSIFQKQIPAAELFAIMQYWFGAVPTRRRLTGEVQLFMAATCWLGPDPDVQMCNMNAVQSIFTK